METSISKKHKLSVSDDPQNLPANNQEEPSTIAKRSRPQTSTTAINDRNDICYQALHIVLQHWLIPDLDFFVNNDDLEKKNTLSDLRENIVKSSTTDTAGHPAAGAATNNQQPSERETIEHLKLYWIRSFDSSIIIKQKLRSLRAENIPRIIADNESTEHRQVTFEEQADTLNRLYEKYWINVSYRLEYFTLNCLLDLRDAFMNLHNTLCNFVERRQRQYSRFSSLVVYQLLTIRQWKDTMERNIKRTLLLFSLISSFFHRERIVFKENNYKHSLQGFVDISKGINNLFERFNKSLYAVEKLDIQKKYVSVLDTIHGITSLLGSIPRQVTSTSYTKSALNIINTNELFHRKIYSIQVHIRRLYTKGIVDVFDETLQQFCCLYDAIIYENALFFSRMEVMSLESTNTSNDTQLTLLKSQFKEARQLNLIFRITDTISSLNHGKINFLSNREECCSWIDNSICHWFRGPYAMFDACYRMQSSLVETIFHRHDERIPSTEPPLTTTQEQFILEFHKWFEIAIKYCWAAVPITKQLLASNNHQDQSDLLHNVRKLLLNEKSYFIEEFVQSLQGLSDSFSWSNETHNDEPRHNLLLKSYYPTFLKYSQQAIQCIDELFLLLQSSSSSNVMMISLVSKLINRLPNRNHTMFSYRMMLHDLVNTLPSISTDSTAIDVASSLYSQCFLLETFRILFARRVDYLTVMLQERRACGYLLGAICNITHQLVQLEQKRFNSNHVRPCKPTQQQQHNAESSFNRELLTVGYFTLLEYIRNCINVVNQRKSPSVSAYGTWFISQEILSYEIRLLLPKLKKSYQALMTRTNASTTTAAGATLDETKDNKDVILFRKRLALVAFTSIVNEILALKPEVFEQRLIKAEDIYDEYSKDGKTIEYNEFLRLVFDSNHEKDDASQNNMHSTLESLIEDNASLSTKLVSRSSNEASSIEGIRRWEYISERVYWKGKVLLKNLLLLDVEAVLKKRYRMPGSNNEDGDDSEQNDDKDATMEVEDSDAGPIDNLNQTASPAHNQEFTVNRLTVNQQLFQDEYNRCASALQFIEDNHLRIVVLDSTSIDSLDGEKFVSVSNEILIDTNQINLYKELSDDSVHASVDQFFTYIVRELYQNQG